MNMTEQHLAHAIDNLRAALAATPPGTEMYFLIHVAYLAAGNAAHRMVYLMRTTSTKEGGV